MSSFVLSKLAIDNMKAIGSYTQMQWGIEQRRFYLKSIDTVFHALADNPKMGTECN